MSATSYILLRIEIEDNINIDTSKQYLETNIVYSLKTLFGDCGAGIPFTVLQFVDFKAVVTVPDSSVVKFRTALTLQGSYQGINCCYTILKVSKSILCIDSI